MKITQHQDEKWYVSINKSKPMEMLSDMGVDVETDLEKLNTGVY